MVMQEDPEFTSPHGHTKSIDTHMNNLLWKKFKTSWETPMHWEKQKNPHFETGKRGWDTILP